MNKINDKSVQPAGRRKRGKEKGAVILIVLVVLLFALMLVMALLTASTGSGFLTGGGDIPPGTSVDVPNTDANGEVINVPPIPGNCLIWSSRVEPSFIPTMRAGSARLGLDPNWIMAIMAVETISTFKPCIRNPFSSATGLIQFMPATARSLGTSIDALCGMSQTQQWRYVEEYFRRNIRAFGRPRDLGGTYMIVFTPAFTLSPDSTVMYRHDGRPCRVGKGMRKTAYCQNQVYDYAPRDGLITKYEAAEAARRKYREGYGSCRRSQ